MGEIKYNTDETEMDYVARRVYFRGPPYGIVTDWIIRRGWATKQRGAEKVLVAVMVVAFGLAVLVFRYAGNSTPPVPPPGEDASQQLDS